MFVTVYLSKMHICYHKENMLNSFYIHKRWSSYFPAKNTCGQTLTQTDWVKRCRVTSDFAKTGNTFALRCRFQS